MEDRIKTFLKDNSRTFTQITTNNIVRNGMPCVMVKNKLKAMVKNVTVKMDKGVYSLK